MFALIKRVLDLAGSFSPAARRSLTWGMVCNILKAFFMAGMLGAVFWALENRDHLDAVVALQCLGILAVSVIGQYVFQYLVDITMDAQGFHIFRDLRLRVGDRLKAAPMGYFSEQRLSAVTTTLTTTVHQLEEFMTICLTHRGHHVRGHRRGPVRAERAAPPRHQRDARGDRRAGGHG